MLEEVGDIFQLSALLMTAAYYAICWNHEADAKAFLDRATPLARALDDPYSGCCYAATHDLSSC